MTTGAAALWLATLLTGVVACSEPSDKGRFEVQVIVFNCYTSSAVQVLVDGRPLALTPPEQRNDSVVTCYDGTAELGPRTQVSIRSRGGHRLVDLVPHAGARFLLISPDLAPYAAFARDAPLLD